MFNNKYCDVLKSVYHSVIISNKYFHSWNRNSIRPPPMLNINKLQSMKFKIVCATVKKKT